MPTIFQQLEDAASFFQSKLSHYEAVDEGHSYSWPNFVYKSNSFRRAHLDIVDARESKKLYMMHLCIFPHVNDPSPIFGFDIIAGPNKVTGAFHDLSPVAGDTSLDTWFAKRTAQQHWSKNRELPEWARNIFSPNIVAAGNIQEEEELTRLLSFAFANMLFYVEGLGKLGPTDYTERQNYYCQNQKQNPHTPRVMSALGLDEAEVAEFIHDCLFPEIAHV
jgi:hypothetical protein